MEEQPRRHRNRHRQRLGVDADATDADVGVDHAPTFTAEDERRERAELTAEDVRRIESDLRGLVLDGGEAWAAAPAAAAGASTSSTTAWGATAPGIGTGGGGASASTAAAATATALLAQLDEAMAKLEEQQQQQQQQQQGPTQNGTLGSYGGGGGSGTDDMPSTAAYRRAQQRCPDQLTPDRLLAFLETERHDPPRAARRLARYWTYRLDLFGEERCYRPMTLLPGGAMEPEVPNLSARRIYEALPDGVTDEAGRSIVHCVPSRRNFAEYTVAQEFQALFYVAETIVQDPIRRRRGVVALMDGRGVARRHFSRQMARYAAIFHNVLPLHLRAHHLCHPSAVQYYVLVPAAKFFSPRTNRLRFVMHYGTEERVVEALAHYRLPRRCLPTSLGGTVVVDMHRWVLDRLDLEQRQRQQQQQQQEEEEAWRLAVVAAARMVPSPSPLPSPPQTFPRPQNVSSGPNGTHDDATCNSGPMTKRVKTDAACTTNHTAADSPSTTVSSGGGGSGRSRGRGAGRGRSDRRMDRALELKLADPDMSLLDALVGGGFVFNDEQDGEVMDMEGVKLTQVSDDGIFILWNRMRCTT